MTTAQLDSAPWFLGRGAGVVALLAFTATVVLGIITRSGRPLPGLPRFAVAEVHRTISLLATSLLAVHVVTLTLDSQAQLRWIDAVLPFTGQWRPFYVGLGALAVDLTLAVVVTSLLRDRIRPRLWRAVHWAAYAMWPLALVHGLGTGTDAGTSWMTGVALAAIAVVAVALVWRLTVVVGPARDGRFAGAFFDSRDRVAGSRRPVVPTRQPAGSQDAVESRNAVDPRAEVLSR